MPGQIVFVRDMILNMQYLADWTVINACKQELICKNNIIENSKSIPHQYKVGEKVMLENHHANKYEQPYKCPYLIVQVNTNGTVCLKIGAVMDSYCKYQTCPSIQNDVVQCILWGVGGSAVCPIA